MDKWSPRWVVSCPECKHEFIFKPIDQPEAETRDPFASPPKPKIPEGGEPLNCPNCNKPSTYGSFDLRYRR
jgi:endogenous inhibitor of DNA gyrase (YacG/DUF329 family)